MSNVLIITGGSRGIGESTIRKFFESGWRVINISRTPTKLANVTHIPIDLSMPDSIIASSGQIRDLLGNESVICLVHNAAYYQPDSIESVSLQTLQSTFAVNLISPMMLNAALIPLMSPGSSIIYIGSTLAQKAVPHAASYTVSKHALIGLMKATQQDLADKAIQTCCINPGLVDTALLKQTMDDGTLTHLLRHKVIGQRLIQPDEIADIVHFCATNSVLNGAVIDANLGQREL